MSICIQLNGETKTLAASCTLSQALTQWGYRPGDFAVAINQSFVPYGHYHETWLQDNDRIDIVTPMQGG